MIVPMRHATLLALANTRAETLGHLRELGVMHVTVANADAPRVRDAQRVCVETEQAIALVKRAMKGARVFQPGPTRPGWKTRAPLNVADVLQIGREISDLEAERESLRREEQRYAPFGEFDPAQAHALAADKIPVTLFRCPAKKFPFATDATCVSLGKCGVEICAVAFGEITLPAFCIAVELPAQNLADTRARLADIRAEIETRNAALVASGEHLPKFQNELSGGREQSVFATAWESMGSHGVVDSIEGFMPAEDVPKLEAAAARHGWGFVLRDPVPSDNVPVLLRPPKIFRPILELLKFLNIAPAYHESDVSVSFYIFFTLFAAMILGDAGYGLVIALALLGARWKMRGNMPRPVFMFGMALGVATLLWGVLTASYFGIPVESLPRFLVHPLAQWFGDSNNMMLFCFILGAAHLGLARLWNAILLFPNLKFLSQAGWIGVLAGIFFFICSIVIEGFAMPGFTVPLTGVGAALVMLFTVGRGEFKTNGVQLVMMPLTLFSAMGDLISYLRLFAIGLASAQVAQNFNLMAVGVELPLWLKIPVVLLIVLFAHALNLVLGGISVVVHAVRLNTLEFANAKGVTWAGSAYRPFKAQTPKPVIQQP